MTSIETAGELFEITVRGALAGAFAQTGVEPDEDQWEMLRGEREITMRDLGNIAHDLDLDLHLDLRPSVTREAQSPVEEPEAPSLPDEDYCWAEYAHGDTTMRALLRRTPEGWFHVKSRDCLSPTSLFGEDGETLMSWSPYDPASDSNRRPRPDE